MATKVIEDNMSPVQCYTVDRFGQVHPNAIVQVGSRVTAVAEFHRKRPVNYQSTITPFLLSRDFVNDTSVTDTNWIGGRIGPPIFLGHDSVTTSQDDGSAALTKALNKLTRDRGSFGETFIEGRATADLLMKNGKRLVSFAQALKRGDMRAAVKALDYDPGVKARKRVEKAPVSKRLSNEYLEFQFGIIPVVEAIRDAAKLYESGMQQEGFKVRSASGRRSNKVDLSNLDPSTFGEGSAVYHGVVTNAKVRNLNSLGLLNIPQEFWNNLPLSFVFDWLIPVGTYLGALTGSAGMSGFAVVNRVDTTVWVYKTGYSEPTRKFNGRTRIDGRRDWIFSPTPSISVLHRAGAVTFGKFVSLMALTRQRL